LEIRKRFLSQRVEALWLQQYRNRLPGALVKRRDPQQLESASCIWESA